MFFGLGCGAAVGVVVGRKDGTADRLPLLLLLLLPPLMLMLKCWCSGVGDVCKQRLQKGTQAQTVGT